MIPTLCFLAWFCGGLPFVQPAQEEFEQGTHVPPTSGEVAPPLETVYWYYAGPEGEVPELKDLRGQVVLVHTWGYYCGPCMKKGVPYVVDLMRANAGRGLSALSITVAVGDGKPDDHFVTVGREQGMNHPLGTADGFGAMTPYVNMNEVKGLTWCFVIGREGGVRWSGDPSIDEEEFIEAVTLALAEEAAPALEERPPEPLKKALAAYVGGDLGKALGEAQKVTAKYAKKKESEEVTAVTAYGGDLVARIEAYRADLLGRLEASFTARDAAAFVAARRDLQARFPKTDAAKRIKALEKELKQEPEFAQAVDAWSAWDELRRARPALFPVRDDKDCQRYAKALDRYVAGAEADLPGLAEARELLAAFEAR